MLDTYDGRWMQMHVHVQLMSSLLNLITRAVPIHLSTLFRVDKRYERCKHAYSTGIQHASILLYTTSCRTAALFIALHNE